MHTASPLFTRALICDYILRSVAVDLREWELVPLYYSIRNDTTSTHMLKTWNFEASHDGKAWVALHEQRHEQQWVPQNSAEPPAFRVLSFPIDSQRMEAFRHFRIIMVSGVGRVWDVERAGGGA